MNKLEDRCKCLKEFQIEMLEKFYLALDQIPIPVLEKFPQFNVHTFHDLKILYQHVKAKLRLVERKLVYLKNEEAKNSLNEKSMEISTSCENSLPSTIATDAANRQSILTISDSDTFSASNINISDSDLSCINAARVQTVAPSTIKDFSQMLGKSNEAQVKEQKDNVYNYSIQNKSSESLIQGKKSTFQLKRPIKATVGCTISKQIGEIWKKGAQSTVINPKPTVPNFNINISSDAKNKLEQVNSGEKIYLDQKRDDNFPCSEILDLGNDKDWSLMDLQNTDGKLNLFLNIYIN